MEGVGEILSLTDSRIKQMKEIAELKEVGRRFREVNLHFNQIRTIGGLELQTNLRVLNLSSNKISELGGLDTLAMLEVLDLSSNSVGWRGSELGGEKEGAYAKVQSSWLRSKDWRPCVDSKYSTYRTIESTMFEVNHMRLNVEIVTNRRVADV